MRANVDPLTALVPFVGAVHLRLPARIIAGIDASTITSWEGSELRYRAPSRPSPVPAGARTPCRSSMIFHVWSPQRLDLRIQVRQTVVDVDAEFVNKSRRVWRRQPCEGAHGVTGRRSGETRIMVALTCRRT